MTRRLPPVASRQAGAFLVDQAYAVGWTPQELRGAVRRADIVRLWRGAYASPVPDTPDGLALRVLQRSIAACLSGHQVAVSHLAGAGARGWPWWVTTPRACATTWSLGLAAVGDVHLHRSTLTTADVVASDLGRPVTTGARTVVDIGREFGLESALVTADAALHRGGLHLDALARALERASKQPGVAGLRHLLDLVEPLTESVLESRSRYRILASGLPRPLCQAKLYDVRGVFIARVDFFWPEYGVVGEADGLGKYALDPGRRTTERTRETSLSRRLGLVVESWGWRDLEPFDPVARRLRNAFLTAPLTTTPRRWRLESELAA